ncbi:hypothetical protein NSS71_08400 [Niallia sp. FSL W8-0951]|uniref:hypothetical protein n=1 Tax=Niallia sp. FSL W8-0951 TaxID=2954639 RepID=UPI0030F8FDFF
MCKGTTNWEDVHIIPVEKIPNETFDKLNKGWVLSHGGIPVDSCIGEEMEELIVKGIYTLGCCCGHGSMQSNALASSTECHKLIKLGYNVKTFKDGIVIFNLKSGTQDEWEGVL